MNESIFGSLARPRADASAVQPREVVPRPVPSKPAFASPPRATPSGTGSPINTAVAPPAHDAPRQSAPSWSSSCDVALLTILTAPLAAGETVAAGFARKEAELRHILATLSVLESRALHSRLSNPKAGDQLANSFLRLTADRRARLINFLADARRREAVRR